MYAYVTDSKKTRLNYVILKYNWKYEVKDYNGDHCFIA